MHVPCMCGSIICCKILLTDAFCRLQDLVLRPHMQPILETLHSNMQAFADSPDAAAVHPSTLRLAMHVISKHLVELQR